MPEESDDDQLTFQKRVKRNRSLRVYTDQSMESWPATFGEMLQWYTNQVEDVTRAAQLRLRGAAKVIEDYRSGRTDLPWPRTRSQVMT